MLNFRNDYSEGAHPHVLQQLLKSNMLPQQGYGADDFSEEARSLIRKLIGNPAASVHFLSGGTQTNLITISFLLRVHEAVISAKTGHIFANETGAIEATGHKVISVETDDGKLTADHIRHVLDEYTLRPHVVKPKLVYISNSTELGTVYTKAELAQLSLFCREHQLLLYVDGARLGHALAVEQNSLTLSEIADMTDVFYIGGTKNGALLGEALVFKNPSLAEDFDYALKQKGALLAKGRLLGIQFLELFKNGLYFELAAHANRMAAKMTAAIRKEGFTFLAEPQSNQIFPVLPDAIIDKLLQNCEFYVWKKTSPSESAVRLITSWATTEQEVSCFIDVLHEACN